MDLCRMPQRFKTIDSSEVAIHQGYEMGSYHSVRLMMRHIVLPRMAMVF